MYYSDYLFGMYSVKRKYCPKCVYFDNEKRQCSKNKIYMKCFRNNEIVLKDKIDGGTDEFRRP